MTNVICDESCLKADYNITKRQVKLLVDIDGCICEYNFPQLVKNFFGVDLSSQAIFAYDLADVLGVSNKLIDIMFRDIVFGKANFIDGSLDVLNEWWDKGYDIGIFSNRVKYMGNFELMKWLKGNKIPFHGIDVKGSGTYNFHIDDSPGKLASTMSGVKILFNQPWNRRCYDIKKQFVRVSSWGEIKDIVG